MEKRSAFSAQYAVNSSAVGITCLFNILSYMITLRIPAALVYYLFPRAMSQVPCLHEYLANAARVRYPAALLRCKLDAPSACCGVFDYGWHAFRCNSVIICSISLGRRWFFPSVWIALSISERLEMICPLSTSVPYASLFSFVFACPLAF